MLFDPRPKTKRDELFDRESEIKEIEDSLGVYPIVVVNGLRRVGKSSILKVFASEHDKCIYIDLRKILSSRMRIEKKSLVEEVKKELQRISKKSKIGEIIKKVKGVEILGVHLDINWKDVDFSELFLALNDVGVVIIFDEAQLLSRYGSRGGRDLLTLFSYVYDNLENVKMIMSGSEIGLLHDFLGIDDYDSPLYGRAVFELYINPFEKEKSEGFLSQGFEEVGVNMEFDINQVLEVFDGIVGYLVMFGLSYIRFKDLKKAMEEALLSAEKVVLKEINELRKRSENYFHILKAISKGFVKWGAVKTYLKEKDVKLSESRLYRLLRNLERLSWISTDEENYKILDPVIERILRRM